MCIYSWHACQEYNRGLCVCITWHVQQLHVGLRAKAPYNKVPELALGSCGCACVDTVGMCMCVRVCLWMQACNLTQVNVDSASMPKTDWDVGMCKDSYVEAHGRMHGIERINKIGKEEQARFQAHAP
jgi:hypothetical protein